MSTEPGQLHAASQELDRLRGDPKRMQPVYSALICSWERFKKSHLAEIAEQKKYSKVGGVKDRVALVELQNAIRGLDHSIAANRTNLKRLKSSPLPCSQPTVQQLTDCFQQATDPESFPETRDCTSPEMKRQVELSGINEE